MRSCSFFFVFLTLVSCQFDKRDFANDPNNIPDIIVDRVSDLELKENEERIIQAVYFRSIEIPSFEIINEDLLLLTEERFLRYFTRGELQEIKFNNCLNIEFDSLQFMDDRIKYDISSKAIYEINYDDTGELYVVPDFKYIHYGGIIKDQEKYQNLNQMILDTWERHEAYDSLTSIFNKFFKKDSVIKVDDNLDVAFLRIYDRGYFRKVF